MQSKLPPSLAFSYKLNEIGDKNVETVDCHVTTSCYNDRVTNCRADWLVWPFSQTKQMIVNN